MGKITLKEGEKLSGLLWINATGLQSMKEESINAEGGRWAYSLRRGNKVALISDDPQVALYDSRDEAIGALMNTYGAGHYIIGGVITSGECDCEEKVKENLDGMPGDSPVVDESPEPTAADLSAPEPVDESPEPTAADLSAPEPVDESPEDAPEPTEEDTKEDEESK